MEVLLRFERASVMLHPLFDRFATVTVGAPGRCPACEEFGFIDHADARHLVQTQHCRACGYRWEYEFRPDGRILEVRGSGPIDQVIDLVATAEDDAVIDLRELEAEPDRGRHVVAFRRSGSRRRT